jgi:hypothetical protein
MLKLPTGEPCAGEPHARFGGRGGNTSRPLSENWNKLTKDFVFEASNNALLHHALVPALKKRDDKWWSKYNWEALSLYLAWAKTKDFNKISPVIWEDECKRVPLSRVVRIPTHRGWLPAEQCYAGSQWGGPESFDEFFLDKNERGLLTEPEDWEKHIPGFNLSAWKGPLRYAGVSWEPKLLRFKSNDGLPFQERIPPNPWKSSFGIKGIWDTYIKSLQPQGYGKGAKKGDKKSTFDYDGASLTEQYAIEYFPECLPSNNNFRLSVIKALAQSIEKEFQKMQYKFSTWTGGGHQHKNFCVSSLAEYQMSL